MSLRSSLCPLLALALAPATVWAGGNAGGPGAATHLHVVVVADTDDSRIGRGCEADLAHLKAFFSDPSNVPPGSVTLREFSGANGRFSQQDLLTYLRTVPVDGATSVLVYFSGHGEFNAQDGHVLVIPGGTNNRLPNNTILEELARRRPAPRLVALLSDSCAENRNKTTRKLGSVPGGCRDLVRNLFFDCTGVVNVNAASEGQFAFGPVTGGLFTTALLQALAEPAAAFEKSGDGVADGFVTWREFFPRLVAGTRGEFQETFRDALPRGRDGQVQQTQVPQAYRLPLYASDHPQLPGRDLGPPHLLGLGVDSHVPRGEAKPAGVVVRHVAANTPAADHFRPGDVILQINGRTVRDHEDFACLLDFAPDSTCTFQFVRDGAAREVSVRLRELSRAERHY